MNVATAGGLSALGQFVLALSCNEAARTAWLTNRAAAIAGSGLSDADKQLLTNNDPTPVANQIVQESGGSGSRIWICTWIR